MKSNADKCHLLVNTRDKMNIKIDNDACVIANVKNFKLLNSPLTFIFINYEKKLHALARVTPYINMSKIKNRNIN